MTENVMGDRLHALEVQVVRLRKVVLAMGVVTAGACLSGFAPQDPSRDVLRARRLEIVDAKGNALGSFGVDSVDESVVGLKLRDRARNQRVELFCDDRGSQLNLLDKNSTPRAVVGYADKSDPDPKGGMSRHIAHFRLLDTLGLEIAGMHAEVKGDVPAGQLQVTVPGLATWSGAILQVDGSGAPRLALVDQKGKVLFEAPK